MDKFQALLQTSWFLPTVFATSVLMFVFSIVGTIIFIKIASHDFFVHEKDHWYNALSEPLRITVLILQNLIGYFLLIIGFALLFLPGQGLLTIMVALILIHFPYKQKLVRALVRKPLFLKTLNAIREKYKKTPFIIDQNHD